MIEGNDGGAIITTDGGKTWTDTDNQPTAQFYRVALDNDFPYHIYGAQQDNTTVKIASRTLATGIDLDATGMTSAAAKAAGSRPILKNSEIVVRRLLRRPDHPLRPPHRPDPQRHRMAG